MKPGLCSSHLLIWLNENSRLNGPKVSVFVAKLYSGVIKPQYLFGSNRAAVSCLMGAVGKI